MVTSEIPRCSCGDVMDITAPVVRESHWENETEAYEPPVADGRVHRRLTGRQRARHADHAWGPWLGGQR